MATALRTQIEGEAKWFSSATIAFHVLFAVFLVKSLLGEDGLSVPQSEAPVAAGAFLGAAAPKNAPAATGASLWGTDKPSSPSKLFTKNTANNTWNAMVAEENHLASPSI